MKQYALTLDLKNDPALIAAYKRHHQAVWPEVIASLRAVGVEEMKIWLLHTRLFMQLETQDDFDLETDLPRYLTLHPRCEEWEALMDRFQGNGPGGNEDEKWVEMACIFQLSEQRNEPISR